jgi:hypothetical protein
MKTTQVFWSKSYQQLSVKTIQTFFFGNHPPIIMTARDRDSAF